MKGKFKTGIQSVLKLNDAKRRMTRAAATCGPGDIELGVLDEARRDRPRGSGESLLGA